MAKVDLDGATRALLKLDPALRPLYKKYGPPDFKPSRNVFLSLARAIVSQQLSGKAADTIWGRVVALCGKTPDAPTILAAEPAALREAGLSWAKVASIKDLAAHISDGRLNPKTLPKMNDADVAAAILPVRGLGPWSVDMFMMFALVRLDVLPTGDLGVKKGMALHFGLRTMPEPAKMQKLAAPWQPYRSIASWYMWRLLENR